MTRTARVVAVLLTVPLLVSAAWAGRNPFRNVWDRPFAAISNGPQGAIVVEEARSPFAPEALASRDRSVRDAIRNQHSPQALSQAVAALRYLQQCGAKDRRTEVRAPRMVVHTAGARPILPDLDRVAQTGRRIGDADNQIAFDFQGWPTADRKALESYLDAAMPIARSVYGPPAFDITVKVIRDEEMRNLQGGTYDVTTNELRLPPLSGNFPEDTYVLIMLVLNAFHDDVALFFDTWEQGMAGAAATVIQTEPGVSPSYRPEIGPFYTIPVYEPCNQPQLGNSTWYPASGFSGMFVFRVGQSRSAWTKCYVEDAQFLAHFNAQYYAKLNSLPAVQRAQLPGDTPSLVEICQSVLPSVEGMPFFAWYRQQYALDTSVSLGTKMFCWNVPVRSETDTGLTDGVILILEHYETGPTGDETPRSGTAFLTYWNYSFVSSLFAQEGYEITIPATGDNAGEGFLFPNFYNVGGEPQRITVQIELNGLSGRFPFPHGLRGFVEKPPNSGNWENTHSIYGTLIGPNTGTIEVVGLGGLSDVEVKNGVWGGELANNFLSPAQLQVTFDDGNGNAVTRVVNVGFDSYGILMPAGTRTGLAHHFPYGTNGLYMMSIPLLAIHSDPAAALGIAADRMLLARWKPNAPGGGKYDIYPDIDPLAPGLGYWLRVLEDTTIAVDGILPPGDEDVTSRLYAGWNQIGCGRNRNVSINDVLIQRGGADAQPFPDAVDDHWVQAGIWDYDQQSGYGLVTTVKPFEGYWVRCLLPQGATLVFPAFEAAARQEQAASATEYSPFGKTIWQAPLVLEFGRERSEATLGVAETAGDGFDARHDLQAPPAFGDQPTLRFTQPDWGDNAGDYVSDFRGSSAKGPWRLQVANLPVGTKARLRWPDLTQLPRNLRPVLIDRATQREIHMRTAAGYDFVGTAAPREFAVELRSGNAGALAVMGLAGEQTRQGVAITYSLTADARVSARVLNIAGRPVRDLVVNRPATAGRSTLLWDLTSASGALVPSGVYLIELAARAEDGQVARGLNRVSVTR